MKDVVKEEDTETPNKLDFDNVSKSFKIVAFDTIGSKILTSIPFSNNFFTTSIEEDSLLSFVSFLKAHPNIETLGLFFTSLSDSIILNENRCF